MKLAPTPEPTKIITSDTYSIAHNQLDDTAFAYPTPSMPRATEITRNKKPLNNKFDVSTTKPNEIHQMTIQAITI